MFFVLLLCLYYLIFSIIYSGDGNRVNIINAFYLSINKIFYKLLMGNKCINQTNVWSSEPACKARKHPKCKINFKILKQEEEEGIINVSSAFLNINYNLKGKWVAVYMFSNFKAVFLNNAILVLARKLFQNLFNQLLWIF